MITNQKMFEVCETISKTLPPGAGFVVIIVNDKHDPFKTGSNYANNFEADWLPAIPVLLSATSEKIATRLSSHTQSRN